MRLDHLTLGLALGFCLNLFQVRAADEPKVPGPEHKKMEVFAGMWKWEETAVASPFGPAGNASAKGEGKMVHGGFFYEEHGSGNGPDGKPSSWTFLEWYDEDTHTYQTLSLDDSGAVSKGTCRFEGDGFVNEWEAKVGGKTYKCKSINHFAPDRRSLDYEWLYSEDGANWKSQLKGKATKLG